MSLNKKNKPNLKCGSNSDNDENIEDLNEMTADCDSCYEDSDEDILA